MSIVTRRLGDVAVTRTGGHRIHAYAGERGYIASCSCGWRVCRRDRDQRDLDATGHIDGTGHSNTDSTR